MPPKKARFENSRGGKRKGKGRGGSYGRYDDRGYYDDYSYRDRRGSDWPHYDYRDDSRSWDYGERGKCYGPSTSNPRERDRFITQMMEDERYHWRKQLNPDFVGNATSGDSSTKSNDHEDGNGDEEAEDCDAKLEKRRKHRADMKQNNLPKLDRLVDVAAQLEHVEEELAKAAADKQPDDKLLTRAEWETIKQSSAEKGRHARELAQLEYDERR